MHIYCSTYIRTYLMKGKYFHKKNFIYDLGKTIVDWNAILCLGLLHVCIQQLYISKCVKVFAYFIFSATNKTFKTSTLHTTIVYYPKVRFQSYLMQFDVVGIV